MTTPTDLPVPAGEVPAFYGTAPYGSEQNIGFLLHRAIKSIRAQADARLVPLDLTQAQWLPLYRLLKLGDGTVAEMAREQDLDCGAMTRALDRLEAKGLVRRERSSTDRRVVNVGLTPEGLEAARHVPGALAEVLNAHLRGFTEAEWKQLCSLLQRVLANGEALRHGGE